MTENDVLGFDPAKLSVFNEDTTVKHQGNSLIYKTQPANSKSEDGVYRSTIKIIYSPFNLEGSILEQQSYSLQDSNGWFQVVSSLTVNDTNCPIFKAWKKCRYAEPGSVLNLQCKSKEEGGKALFDKRFARYVTVQIMEDKNQPELVGKYMFWKLPKSIWDIINAKMNPSAESGRASLPIMDFLFGRAIELEVFPGPNDPAAPERKTRETKYMGEISDDIVTCTNPDGSSLLDKAEQEVLDKYIEQMSKVWKNKVPAERAEMLKTVNADPNTVELRKIYVKAMEKIKEFCPDLNKELSYNEWTPEVKARVDAWINVVLSGNDPTMQVTPTVLTQQTQTPTPAATAAPAAPAPEDDLPF